MDLQLVTDRVLNPGFGFGKFCGEMFFLENTQITSIKQGFLNFW